MNHGGSWALIEGDALAAFRYTLRVAKARNDDLAAVFAAVEQHPAARLGSLIDDVMCVPETWGE